jgi:hypothetical protein
MSAQTNELLVASESSDNEAVTHKSRARKLGFVGAGLLAAAGLVGIGYKLGASSTSVHADVAALEESLEISPPGKMCSKVNEECGGTKCCKLTGYKCYNKNATFNGCAKACPYNGATPPLQFGKWTCDRPDSLIPSKPGAPEPSVSGPSLFCFEAFMTNPGQPKEPMHELELVRTQLQTHTSIFGCSQWRVFSDKVTEISPGNPGPALYTVAVECPTYLGLRKEVGTYINTPFFQNIWKSIKADGEYKNHQWTIKADVDAVMFPARLAARLAPQEVTSGGIYIVNCRYVKDGFFGPLEVISTQAATAFFENMETCDTELDWKSGKQPWGEDKFMEQCMAAHGVDAVEDLKLINDAVCDMIELKSKMAQQQGVKYDSIKMKPKVQKCVDKDAIAFHPLIKPYDYFECVKKTQE